MIRSLLVLAAVMTLAPLGGARAAFDDPEADILSDVVAVAPSYGPAWWRVSKGASIVWIMGLPGTNTPRALNWDRRTAERRLTGARLFIGTPEEKSRLAGRWEEPLAMSTQARVALAATQIGLRSDRYWPPSLLSVWTLRGDYQKQSGFGLDVEDQMLTLARRKRVKVSKPRDVTVKHTASDLSQYETEVEVCLAAMLTEVETDPASFRTTAALWASGRVAEVLAAPRDAWSVCMNRMTPGYSRRVIETQTAAIAAALATPGRAVAVAPIRQLVAQDGILAHLRAQGFTVADPKNPLED